MRAPLPDFAAVRLLAAGDAMLDRYWSGDAGRISPEAPVPVVDVRGEELRAGGAANVAARCSSPESLQTAARQQASVSSASSSVVRPHRSTVRAGAAARISAPRASSAAAPSTQSR